jgi:hypothetical protein
MTITIIILIAVGAISLYIVGRNLYEGYLIRKNTQAFEKFLQEVKVKPKKSLKKLQEIKSVPKTKTVGKEIKKRPVDKKTK